MPEVLIGKHTCTLYFDYDYHSGVLKKLDNNEKIEWLEKRMDMLFLKPISTLLDREGDVYKSLNKQKCENDLSDGTILSVSILMNGIEALGSFLIKSNKKPKKVKNKPRFLAFITNYMKDVNDWNAWTQKVANPRDNNKLTPLSDILWGAYRNGLAHSFAIIGAGIEKINSEEKHKIENGVLQIDIWKFFSDFQEGVKKMFDDVRKPGETQKLFLDRFKDVYLDNNRKI